MRTENETKADDDSRYHSVLSGSRHSRVNLQIPALQTKQGSNERYHSGIQGRVLDKLVLCWKRTVSSGCCGTVLYGSFWFWSQTQLPCSNKASVTGTFLSLPHAGLVLCSREIFCRKVLSEMYLKGQKMKWKNNWFSAHGWVKIRHWRKGHELLHC